MLRYRADNLSQYIWILTDHQFYKQNKQKKKKKKRATCRKKSHPIKSVVKHLVFYSYNEIECDPRKNYYYQAIRMFQSSTSQTSQSRPSKHQSWYPYHSDSYTQSTYAFLINPDIIRSPFTWWELMV